MVALALAFLAGTLTIANPCVLPLLPFVFASSIDAGRHAPLALISGLLGGFVIVGLAVAALGFGLGFDPLLIRQAAAVAFVGFGLVMLSGALQRRLALATAPITGSADTAIARARPVGAAGQVLTGALLGAVWTPCTGPALGAAIGLAGASGGILPAAAIMLAFGAGAGTVLLALAYGSREVLRHRGNALAGAARWARPVLGAVLVIFGALILTGLDRRLEAALVAAMPDWLVVLTTSI